MTTTTNTGWVAPGQAGNVRDLPRRRAAEARPSQELTGHRADAHARLSGGEDHDVRMPEGGPVPGHVDGTALGRAAVPVSPAPIAEELAAETFERLKALPDKEEHLRQVARAASMAAGTEVTPEDVQQLLTNLPAMLRAAMDEPAPADPDAMTLAETMTGYSEPPEQAEETRYWCGSLGPLGTFCRREVHELGPCVGWIIGGEHVQTWVRR